MLLLDKSQLTVVAFINFTHSFLNFLLLQFVFFNQHHQVTHETFDFGNGELAFGLRIFCPRLELGELAAHII